MITLLTIISFAGIIGYYFKFKLDAKSKQRKAKGAKNPTPVEPDAYEEIIDDYPTYHRQVK